MSALATIRDNIDRARHAIQCAEKALEKGHVATCSYELDAAAERIKSARQQAHHAMRTRIAAEEKEGK